MGTRVDFYVGRGERAEWLGSYPYDGYPYGVFQQNEELPSDEQGWRAWVANFLERSDEKATLPEHGWPWPWETSATTDFAYAFDAGKVYGSNFGRDWFEVDPTVEDFGEPEEDSPKTAVFPDMSSRKAVTYGPRSGLIVMGFAAGGTS